MKKQIIIELKDGTVTYTEDNLDCHKLTIMGHASGLINEWKQKSGGVYSFDNYNAVLLDDIVSVKVQ